MKFAKKVKHVKAGASRAQFDKLALINAIIETVSTRNQVPWASSLKQERTALETLISPFGVPKLNEFKNAKPAGDDGNKYESKHFTYAIKALKGDFSFMEVYLVQLQKWSSEGKPISPIGEYLKSVDIPVASEVPVVAPVVAPVVRQSARIASQAAQNAPQVPQAPMLNAPLIRVEEVAPVEEFEEFIEEIAPVEEVAPRQRRKKTREPGSLSAEALEMLETGRLIADGPGSDDLKLKQLHSVERDFLKGTSKVPQYLEAFFKAKQKLENELGKPLIFGGGLRTMFIDRKLADDFTKAAAKKVVKLEGSLAEKELTLAEQIEKIKKEDDEKNAISEFLDAESKKPSHARDSELIAKLKKAGFMMKKAVVVDKLSAVPDRILVCYANLPLTVPVVKNFKYETRELFSMMKSKSKLKVHVTIPFVNGEPDGAYREVYEMIKPLANNQVPDSVFKALGKIGVIVNKESDGAGLIYALSEVSVFDGIVYDDSIVSLNLTRPLTTEDILDEETKFDEKVDKEVLKSAQMVAKEDLKKGKVLDDPEDDVKKVSHKIAEWSDTKLKPAIAANSTVAKVMSYTDALTGEEKQTIIQFAKVNDYPAKKGETKGEVVNNLMGFVQNEPSVKQVVQAVVNGDVPPVVPVAPVVLVEEVAPVVPIVPIVPDSFRDYEMKTNLVTSKEDLQALKRMLSDGYTPVNISKMSIKKEDAHLKQQAQKEYELFQKISKKVKEKTGLVTAYEKTFLKLTKEERKSLLTNIECQNT